MEQGKRDRQEKGIYICGLLLLGLLLLWLGAEHFLGVKLSLPPCVFHSITGLYCPGCGGTRACRLLFSGHFFRSFLYHPAVLPAAVFYVWFMVSHTIELLSRGRLKVGLPYSDRFLYIEAGVILLQCLIKNIIKLFWGIGIL